MKLYILPISETEKIPEALFRERFPKRMERADRYRRREDALRCMAAGALTAFVLGASEEEISVNSWGKPGLSGGNLFFSLSHSGDYALLAVSGGETGADIERLAEPDRRVAAKMFTKEELSFMEEAPEARFFALWTLKESVMKADGRGFSLSPVSFSVLPFFTGGTITVDGRTYYGFTGLFRDYALSAVSEEAFEKPALRVLTAEELLNFDEF